MCITIKDGKLFSSNCEINAVYHCNLSCRSCSHLSPLVEKYVMEVDRLRDDLTLLQRVYHAEYANLLGGEPLLHPELPYLIETVRETGIADKIKIVTNGILLPRMPEILWELTDIIVISLYSPAFLPEKTLDILKDRAVKYNVELEVRYFDYFREAFALEGPRDETLIKRIYNTCQIAHIWCCHNIDRGYFYKCPQAIFLPKWFKREGSGAFEPDRVKISDTADFFDRLCDYLQSSEPLETCRYCLGSAGKRFQHQQAQAGNLYHYGAAEDALDWEQLELLEKDPDTFEMTFRTT